ncbi:alpha/beta fold hydrolase [Actinoplanes sp. N902-109]|uniref:alpha/beta fold hydrolase n=1 Tax=Actinoplanes sp. (strain N902-109) TaxID=649831 RepID=UPI00032960BC|nr:alpha/beta hydrolase [Actinoplanes sp. N902-109]AGL14377.1 alpha/beta hydrolase fold protein [Actinoplanes sp. N902-109]
MIAYDDHGHGHPTLVAIAGGAARHPDYLGDLAGLSAGHRLIRPHLRGVGRTPLTGGGSYREQTPDLDDLRAGLGLDRMVLLAHSAGTRLAMHYAVRFPDRVAALVLITPPAADLVAVPSDAGELIAARAGDPVIDAAVAARSTLHHDDAWWRVVAPLGYARWGTVEREHARVGEINFAANQAFRMLDPPGDLTAVTAPVLVVAGAQDCLTGFEPVAALAGVFPRGELAVIEDCGHYPWVEQPAAFRRAVDAFLAQRV